MSLYKNEKENLLGSIAKLETYEQIRDWLRKIELENFFPKQKKDKIYREIESKELVQGRQYWVEEEYKLTTSSNEFKGEGSKNYKKNHLSISKEKLAEFHIGLSKISSLNSSPSASKNLPEYLCSLIELKKYCEFEVEFFYRIKEQESNISMDD